MTEQPTPLEVAQEALVCHECSAQQCDCHKGRCVFCNSYWPCKTVILAREVVRLSKVEGRSSGGRGMNDHEHKWFFDAGSEWYSCHECARRVPRSPHRIVKLDDALRRIVARAKDCQCNTYLGPCGCSEFCGDLAEDVLKELDAAP